MAPYKRNAFIFGIFLIMLQGALCHAGERKYHDGSIFQRHGTLQKTESNNVKMACLGAAAVRNALALAKKCTSCQCITCTHCPSGTTKQAVMQSSLEPHTSIRDGETVVLRNVHCQSGDPLTVFGHLTGSGVQKMLLHPIMNREHILVQTVKAALERNPLRTKISVRMCTRTSREPSLSKSLCLAKDSRKAARKLTQHPELFDVLLVDVSHLHAHPTMQPSLPQKEKSKKSPYIAYLTNIVPTHRGVDNQ